MRNDWTTSVPANDGLPPHALSAQAVLQTLGAEAANGLDGPGVSRARAVHGCNRLAEAPPAPSWKKFLDQFRELVIWLLLAAALVAAALGEWADTAAIMAIVAANALIGFLQQRKAEQAINALRRLSAPVAKVIRSGRLQTTPASELVPGDFIELEAGDHVPADARLLRGFGVRVQEAALTGESAPVEKDPESVLDRSTALGDRRNMVYLGTVMAAGKASAVIVGTGMNTELGRIAGLLRQSHPEPTPLQRRLTSLGRVLVFVCMVLVGVIAVLQLGRGGGFVETLRLAVSLAVAAVPEGLPAVVTITLAVGLQRMVKRHALIRKLASVETLGSVTVICSDKTGTLTRNEMTVREVLAGGASFKVTGDGYGPKGVFLKATASDALHAELLALRSRNGLGSVVPREPVDPRSESDLTQALKAGLYCNHARVNPCPDGGDGWRAVGDPTEAALVVAARKAGLEHLADGREAILLEIPFDSERKAMSVVVGERGGRATLYAKGAPEVILAKCAAIRWAGKVETLTESHREAMAKANAEMAARALRVLALAYREGVQPDAGVAVETDLVFAGLMGLIDPPRDEAKEAIRTCRTAGIRPVMITGDHPATALAVGRELRLAEGSERVVTGRELDGLSDAELAAQVEQIAVYARVSSEHKLRVVRAWQARGQVVAMTGDGVNDAPAVKAADIGIAMGITGADVTKEAAAMVLTDDNFTAIVDAVEEGRAIYANIQKFVHYLLAGNANKLLVMLAAVVLGWQEPLLAIQILWLNLITDGLPALALGMEGPERGLMRRQPRPPGEALIPFRGAVVIVGHGILLAAAALTGFHLIYQGGAGDVDHARVVAFCVMGLAQLCYAFAARSRTETAFGLGLFSNPYLLAAVAASGLLQLGVVLLPFVQPFFGVKTTPSAGDWALIVGLAVLPAILIDLAKLVYRGWQRLGGALPDRVR